MVYASREETRVFYAKKYCLYGNSVFLLRCFKLSSLGWLLFRQKDLSNIDRCMRRKMALFTLIQYLCNSHLGR
ncbi:hypothetical protein Palpr_1588 [Paludibacter propionicigenes WB4]|uniref:Uncharacterized protein n=1 Tax=Paludibacter propionicigenes (strain DSM 17365 / JCM 13257 / WB4) TaxID=694427 RepID=E4T4T7_PALPW|nr:hypothetical protein Palpr_1588 [Paludibacter propionicigenes WB4]